MLRCKIKSEYVCIRQIKTGKGLWDMLDTCEDCIVFRQSGQITLLQANPLYWVRCPLCEVPFRYYKTVTNLYKCKYCGSFVHEKELIPA